MKNAVDTWRTEWVQKKNALALKLAARQYGGSYGEAVMILCTTLSAMAAKVWPGDRIDRVRFTQLLVDFAPEDLHTTRVSIPLLLGHLRAKGRATERDAIQKTFLEDDTPARIIIGDDVDQGETAVRGIAPTLHLKEVREHSYANLLYKELRSGYAHRYGPGERADSFPMTRREDVAVSYGNWMGDPDRHIYFHIRWLSQLACAVAEAVDARASALPQNRPGLWWVCG